FRLVGIIYHGGYHFTARIFDLLDQCWYHDGIATKTKFVPEGLKDNVDLFHAEGRVAALALY
ncbi:hypothetical protein FA95DRAFT_1479505, partial [Auriscalpium vulgare]